MHTLLLLLLGVACAGLGGELFLRGTIGIAHAARVAPGIIGATVAAFATSSPELSIAVNSATAGEPEITLGDALGSNVVNIVLILALALLLGEMRVPGGRLGRDQFAAISAPFLVGSLGLDGHLTGLDGLVLAGCFGGWLWLVVAEARRQRSGAEAVLGEARTGKAILEAVGGLALLVLSGRLIVEGGTGIAAVLGLSPFVVGAVIVALGTSMPELATVVISRIRRHDEVSLGAIMGSNVFNALLIIAVAAMIHPIRFEWGVVGWSLGMGVLAVLLTVPDRKGLLTRARGVLMLLLYAAYVLTTVQSGRGHG